MSWYIRNILSIRGKTSSAYGEWWIDESGNAIYADGDVGDVTHMGHVIDTIIANYGGEQEEDADSFFDRVAQGYMSKQTPEQRQSLLPIYQSNPAQIAYKELSQMGMSPEEFLMLNGGGDPILYALKNWGWKRVADTTVETWTASPQDLRIIAEGLYDANGYEEDGGGNVSYYIEVRSSNKIYGPIPLSKLGKDGLNLRNYASSSQLTKTAGSAGWQEGFTETLGDVQRYLYDAYTARVYITKLADKKITVSVGLYHLMEGNCMYQDWWRFEPTEESKARGVFGKVKAAVEQVFKDFKTNELPNPLLYTHIRESTRFISPENNPTSRIPLVDYARNITCVTDWRQTLYPNRYPESDGF